MSDSGPPADDQVRRLLDVLRAQREARCAELLGQAAEEAQRVAEQALGDARLRMRESVRGVRQRMQQELAAAEASRQTRRRQRRQHADQALLAALRPRLRKALEGRWRDSAGRSAWITAVLDQAERVLVEVEWLIEHPADWPDAERAAVSDRLATQRGQAPHFAARADMVAGLRVRAGYAWVDGSVDGLLHGSADIDGRLLAGLAAARRGDGGGPHPVAE